MSSHVQVAEVLGLKNPTRITPLELIRSVATGLPSESVIKLAEAVRPADRQFRYDIVPRATAARRQAGKLTKASSEKVARVAKVWAAARDVWGGDQEARDFLFRPHPMLEDQAPMIVVLDSALGADLVCDILGGLRYGSAA